MRLKVKPSRSRSARRKRLRDELEGKLRNRKFLGSTSWNLSIPTRKFRRSRREARVHEGFLAVTLPSHDNFRETRFRL